MVNQKLNLYPQCNVVVKGSAIMWITHQIPSYLYLHVWQEANMASMIFGHVSWRMPSRNLCCEKVLPILMDIQIKPLIKIHSVVMYVVQNCTCMCMCLYLYFSLKANENRLGFLIFPSVDCKKLYQCVDQMQIMGQIL